MSLMAVDVNDMAAEVIQACGRYVQDLARVHGEFSPRCAGTAVSWARAIGEAIGMTANGGSLARDGERSLYGITSYGMHFGVIYRPDGRFRDVMTGPDRALMCLHHGLPALHKEAEGCEATDRTEHQTMSCYVADAPIPGEWTIHS